MVTVFKENLNLQLLFSFYSSIMFEIKTVTISEEITEYKFGALLEISNKFITMLSAFSCMILQFRLKISQPYCMALKHRYQVALLKRQYTTTWYTGVRDETFKSGKRYDNKLQCLSPHEACGPFFLRSFSGWDKHFWVNFQGVVLYGGLMIRSCQGGQKVSQMHFPVIWAL